MTVRLVAGDVDTAQVNCALRQLDRRIEEVARTSGTTAPPVNITDLAREVAAFIGQSGPPAGSLGQLTFGVPPVPIGVSLAEGSSLNPARADHVHTVQRPFPAAIVFASPAAAIVNNTLTKLTFTSDLYDPIAMHDLVTNPSRITLPYTGVWHVGGFVTWAALGAGRCGMFIYTNGGGSTTIGVLGLAVTDVGIGTYQNGTIAATFTAGDYIEMSVYQNSGGDHHIDATMWCSYLGPSS